MAERLFQVIIVLFGVRYFIIAIWFDFVLLSSIAHWFPCGLHDATVQYDDLQCFIRSVGFCFCKWMKSLKVFSINFCYFHSWLYHHGLYTAIIPLNGKNLLIQRKSPMAIRIIHQTNLHLKTRAKQSQKRTNRRRYFNDCCWEK